MQPACRRLAGLGPAAEAIRAKRVPLRYAAVVVETGEADLLAGVIGLLHRRVTPQ